jgi:hypothetical protein
MLIDHIYGKKDWDCYGKKEWDYLYEREDDVETSLEAFLAGLGYVLAVFTVLGLAYVLFAID